MTPTNRGLIRSRRRLTLGSVSWGALLVLLYLFLLAPIVVGVIISFSSASSFVFPPPGLSLKWYEALLNNTDFTEGIATSIQLALAATLFAVVVGGGAAIAVTRGRFPGRDVLLNVLTLPLAVPAVVLGLGLLLVIAPLGLLGSMPILLGAHTLITMPFVAQIIAAGIRATPREYEQAALSLGATPAVAFRRILLPQILPSILASGAIAFIVSMGETSITLLIIGEKSTLPVVMYRFVTGSTDPTLAALSVVFLGFTLAAVLVVQLTIGGLRRLAPSV